MENFYFENAEKRMKMFDSLINESEEQNIEKRLSREIQKIKPIPLDMFGAKYAINNIIQAEISRNTVSFDRTLPQLMSLDLTNVTTRSKFRFDNYYKRFLVSRNRGFDFEGMIAGFLDADISIDKNSPFDIVTNNEKISLKTLNNSSESVVIKSIVKTVSEFIKNYKGSEENRQEAMSYLASNNPLKYLFDSGNDDLINLGEDIVNESLSGIDSVLIGIPKKDNKIELFYFNKETLVRLSKVKGAIVNPKSSGSKQLRFSSSILSDADLYGSIKFPNLTNEDYENFFIGDEKTNNTINTLNKFGMKYGVNGLGSQLPQDIIMDLTKSENFITDMNFIIGKEE